MYYYLKQCSQDIANFIPELYINNLQCYRACVRVTHLSICVPKNELFTKIRINQIFAYDSLFVFLDSMHRVLFFVAMLCEFDLFPDLRICAVTRN